MKQGIELLSVLYELSLTNIAHSDPVETAHKFLRKFLSRKSIHFGAIWIFKSVDKDHIYLDKLYSLPNVEFDGLIKIDHYEKSFGDKNLIILDHSLLEGERPAGTYAYFKLNDLGLMEVFHSSPADKLTREYLYPFQDVVKQLALSLQSGFNHASLKEQIEQRKSAELSLIQNEEKYKRIIDNIDLGLLEVDVDEKIEYANGPFLKLVGYDLEEIIGKKAADLFIDAKDTELFKELEKNRKIRKSGNHSSYEIPIRDKEGNKKWVIISGAPNYDSDRNIIGSIGIYMEITEQKKLREEMAFKDDKNQKLIDLSLDALVSINQLGEIFEWSPQAEVVFGYTHDEIMGKKLSDTIIPTQYREAHDHGMKHYLSTGEGPVINSRIEITALRKSGEEFPIELTIFPMKFEGQHYFTAFMRDISELKASRENMEKALQRQKELNEMKSKFISMTSHELRTPLTTIRSNTELISYQLENIPELDRHKLKKNTSRIDFNVDRLNQLISNILMIGQMDSDKIPFQPKNNDAIGIIEKVVLPHLSDQSRKVVFRHEGVPYEVSMDKKLFIHILSNLLENALKYSEGSKPPELTLLFDKNQIKIDVRDYGLGIPKEEQGLLFDSFFRASNVGNIQGSGLGLSIVNEFVKRHGGTIEIDSELNVGTVFTIFLPK